MQIHTSDLCKKRKYDFNRKRLTWISIFVTITLNKGLKLQLGIKSLKYDGQAFEVILKRRGIYLEFA